MGVRSLHVRAEVTAALRICKGRFGGSGRYTPQRIIFNFEGNMMNTLDKLKLALGNLPKGMYLEKHKPNEHLGTNVYALRYPSEAADRGYCTLATSLEPELAEFLKAAIALANEKETPK